MRVRYATEPAPGRAENEDHVFHVGDLVGVLDGVSAPAGLDTGCVHGPAWYVRRLASHLQRTAANPAIPLTNGGVALSAGFTPSHPHRTARPSDQDSTEWICRTVDADNGSHTCPGLRPEQCARHRRSIA